jgi:hypothetical protein
MSGNLGTVAANRHRAPASAASTRVVVEQHRARRVCAFAYTERSRGIGDQLGGGTSYRHQAAQRRVAPRLVRQPPSFLRIADQSGPAFIFVQQLIDHGNGGAAGWPLPFKVSRDASDRLA